MNTLILKNAWLCGVKEETVHPRICDIEIADGKISRIRAAGSDSHGAGESVDLQGRVVTQPLVNFHEHAYSRLAKGLAISGPMMSFPEILENLWWKLDRALDQDSIRGSAEQTALDSIACGVGYVFDHHSSPSSIEGSLEILASTFQESGLRSVLCYESSDRNGPDNASTALKENLESANAVSDHRKAMLGLHAPFTLSDETLNRAHEICSRSNLSIHTHLAEDRSENRICFEKYGTSAASRLANFDLLDERAIVAHGVHLTDSDLDLLNEARVGLACCPESNLNNSVDVADYARIPNGISILCGTDGMHANIARTMKLLFLLYRHQGGSVEQTFAWLSRVLTDQRRFVRRYFPDYPDLNVGDRADILIWDYVPPTEMSETNFLGHYIYGILESRPNSLLMAGRLLMQDFELMTSDLQAKRRFIAEQGARVAKEFSRLQS